MMLILVRWTAVFLIWPMREDVIGASFLHSINLPFHEAGHILFSPFGEFMTTLGGSLMQVLVPAACAIAFLTTNWNPFGAAVMGWWAGQNLMDVKRVGSGLLMQTADNRELSLGELKVVTKKQPTQQELQDLLFAWKVAKYVKSNAIVFCKDGMTMGVGAGQMSRLDSARIASIKAQHAGLSYRRDDRNRARRKGKAERIRDGFEHLGLTGAALILGKNPKVTTQPRVVRFRSGRFPWSIVSRAARDRSVVSDFAPTRTVTC